MASKTYTAQEMRQQANQEQHLWNNNKTAEMLRQAADLIEREEKREKKYEYSLRYSRLNGISKLHEDDFNLIEKSCHKTVILRRPVGEWEEVSND